MAAPSLTPALGFEPERSPEMAAVWADLLAKLERLAELEKSRPLLPENELRVIELMAPFLASQERDPCERIYDLLPALKTEDPAKHRAILVATLTDGERELCEKMSAGVQHTPSAPPAVKSHNGHESQLRSPDGRWRASLSRRVVNASAHPRLPGAKFFTG